MGEFNFGEAFNLQMVGEKPELRIFKSFTKQTPAMQYLNIAMKCVNLSRHHRSVYLMCLRQRHFFPSSLKHHLTLAEKKKHPNWQIYLFFKTSGAADPASSGSTLNVLTYNSLTQISNPKTGVG